MQRCPWCEKTDLERAYHDTEWGVPVFSDEKQFEFLVLESAQAGLSWLTVLRKRENYRRLYDGFDPEKVAGYGEKKIQELMSDSGIIRNRKKIEASINNAARFLEVRDEFGSFSDYLWGFTGGVPVTNSWEELSEIPASTELSVAVSRDLKKRGFRFMGPVIVYSHLQATGVVNDHLVSCFRYEEILGLSKGIE
ncbi:MAG: DNA-3-methyladenine glycosylase I [Candidatus Dadabacteria bacterium]|nr:DNA-3-methyladenine glycosylase I [Candidatus Dadabacteria bacterium]MYC39789.1 DNA-3-methyladenine glycosylase I [Candidatus Dadabacteria bacterium]